MSDRTELQAKRSNQAKPGSTEADARPVAPAVDVFEDGNGITLLADMPGVSRESLEIRLEGDSLAIEGRVELDLPADMRAVWAEVQVPRFRRVFALSRELDSSHIDANLKDGVLTLRVPKLAHAKPRRIEVKTS